MKKVVQTLIISLVGVMVLAACGGASPEANTAPASGAPAEQSVTKVAGERVFVIDPAQSEVRYEAQEEFLGGALSQINIEAGNVVAIGRTKGVNGSIALNLEASPITIGDSRFQVDVKSLTSDDNRRDNQIRKRYLESNNFPLAEFVATGVEDFPADFAEGEPVTFKLTGDLTIRNITKPATFDVTATLKGDTLSGTATTTVFAADYGFQAPNIAGILRVTDGFKIVFDFVAKEG